MFFSRLSNVLILVLSLMVLMSCKEEPPVPDDKAKIEIASHATYGQILVNGAGETLYFFSKDVGGASVCTGNCLVNWPAYTQTDFEVGTGLSKDDFKVIDHPEGGKMVSYKGWPLYFFAGDSEAGDTKGEAVGGNWFVAKPNYDVMIAEKEIDGANARYLTDAVGNTLYTFSNDAPNTSNCKDGCLVSWPAFTAADVIAPSVISGNSFTNVTHSQGANQTVFKEQPLYYYAPDAQAGDINGQGAGGVWFVIKEDAYK